MTTVPGFRLITSDQKLRFEKAVQEFYNGFAGVEDFKVLHVQQYRNENEAGVTWEYHVTFQLTERREFRTTGNL